MQTMKNQFALLEDFLKCICIVASEASNIWLLHIRRENSNNSGFFTQNSFIFAFWYQRKKKIELASLARVTLFDLSAVFVGRDEFWKVRIHCNASHIWGFRWQLQIRLFNQFIFLEPYHIHLGVSDNYKIRARHTCVKIL